MVLNNINFFKKNLQPLCKGNAVAKIATTFAKRLQTLQLLISCKAVENFATAIQLQIFAIVNVLVAKFIKNTSFAIAKRSCQSDRKYYLQTKTSL